MSITKK